jgi:hypothetical protein
MNHSRANPKSEAFARWLRESLSWRSIASGLVTLAWLIPVTVVIWVYADRAQVVPVDNVSIPITVHSTDSNRFVMLEMESATITAQLSGPLSRIDDIRQAVNPSDGRPTVSIPIDSSLPPGTHDLDTAQQIAQSQIFRYSGITIKDCKPARIRVIVDEYETREAEVKAPGNATNLVGAPTFTPPKVLVRAPRSFFPTSNQPLTVVAEIPRAGVLDTPGQHRDIPVPVSAPQLASQAGVSYLPAVASGLFDVRPLDDEGTLRLTVVNLEIPKNISDRYEVKYENTITNLRVIGPPDKIDELMRENSVKPYLVLKVTGQDRPGVTRPRLLEFRQLPDQVRLHPEDAPKINIDFTLVERAPQP